MNWPFMTWLLTLKAETVECHQFYYFLTLISLHYTTYQSCKYIHFQNTFSNIFDFSSKMEESSNRLLNFVFIIFTVCFILFISERNYKNVLNLNDEPSENLKWMVSLSFYLEYCKKVGSNRTYSVDQNL